MANGYESQRVGSRSGGGMTELMQILKMFQGGGGGQDRQQRAFDDLYKEYGRGLEGIHDNKTLEIRKTQFDKYFEDNKRDMDENTLSKFELLNEKFNSQKKI